MKRDLKSHLTVSKSLSPAARTASANGTGIDVREHDGVVVAFEFGAITDGTHTPSVEESDDNSSFTAVAADDQIGTLAAGSANTPQWVGYRGRKRYVRGVITVTGSPSTGAVASCAVITGYGHYVS